MVRISFRVPNAPPRSARVPAGPHPNWEKSAKAAEYLETSRQKTITAPQIPARPLRPPKFAIGPYIHKTKSLLPRWQLQKEQKKAADKSARRPKSMRKTASSCGAPCALPQQAGPRDQTRQHRRQVPERRNSCNKLQEPASFRYRRLPHFPTRSDKCRLRLPV